MAVLLLPQILVLLAIATVALRLVASDGSFRLLNNCPATVWVGAVSNAGIQPLSMDNVMLSTGQSMTVTTASNWGGRFWGRTGCARAADGTFSCAMGDCNGLEQCAVGGKPPATLAEFTLSGADNKDFYDVSLVDGYNLPLAVAPDGGGQGRNESDPSSCGAAGCTGDLNQNCPTALQVLAAAGGGNSVVGCRSACDAFQDPRYCCTGANSLPSTCQPTDYSRTFKQSCPKAYSYAYDDPRSLFTCMGGRYTITFCPVALPDDTGTDGDGVQFPEAQPVSDNDPSISSPTLGTSSSVGTNFRIITPSSANSQFQSWSLLTLAGAAALVLHRFA